MLDIILLSLHWREENKIKRIKNCIKYISMECLLFTFSIFETCKEKKGETVIIEQHL